MRKEKLEYAMFGTDSKFESILKSKTGGKNAVKISKEHPVRLLCKSKIKWWNASKKFVKSATIGLTLVCEFLRVTSVGS